MVTFEEYKRLPEIVLAQKFPNRKNDEDLLQEARLELWICIREQLNADNFFSYAYSRIRNHVAACIRREKTTIELTEQNSPAIEDIYNDVDVERLLAKLNDRDSRIVQLRWQGYTYREIGAQMGLSGQRVSQLAKRIVKRLED